MESPPVTEALRVALEEKTRRDAEALNTSTSDSAQRIREGQERIAKALDELLERSSIRQMAGDWGLPLTVHRPELAKILSPDDLKDWYVSLASPYGDVTFRIDRVQSNDDAVDFMALAMTRPQYHATRMVLKGDGSNTSHVLGRIAQLRDERARELGEQLKRDAEREEREAAEQASKDVETLAGEEHAKLLDQGVAWKWPRHLSIELCEIRWCSGGSEGEFDYETAYVISETPNQHGFFTTHTGERVRPPSTPLVMLKRYSSIEALPRELKELAPGIESKVAWRWGSYWVKPNGEGRGQPHIHNFGYIPIPSVRDLVAKAKGESLAMGGPTSADRARWALDSLNAFCDHIGIGGLNSGDPSYPISEMLSCLLHLARSRGAKPEDVIKHGREHFEADLMDEFPEQFPQTPASIDNG